MVRPQPGGAADPQRGARRRRNGARRARDVVRSHEPGARRVRGARGDDAGRARSRRLLDARAAQRGGGRARRGAAWALGFTNPMAGPILVGKLGWEDVTSLRIWVRPKRLRKRPAGRCARPVSACSTSVTRHRSPRITSCAMPRYLNWRYADSPRPYLRVEDGRGWAVVTHAVWHGYSSAVVCEAVGGPRLLRRCVQAVDADLAVAMVNPGEERTYLAAGFVPTPAHDPLHRQAADGRRAGAAEATQSVALHARRPGLLLMRRLIFATQKLDPDDPVLAATVPMVRALAARVDELVVLCDSAVPAAVPANARVHEFGARTQAERGARFVAALARELRPRPIGVVAHMVPLYAVLAAPLVRPLGDPARALVHALEGARGRARRREGVDGGRLGRRALVPARLEEGARDRARHRRRRVRLHGGARRAVARARARPLLAGEGARDDPARRGARRRARRGARLRRDVRGVQAQPRAAGRRRRARRPGAARASFRRSSRAATC